MHRRRRSSPSSRLKVKPLVRRPLARAYAYAASAMAAVGLMASLARSPLMWGSSLSWDAALSASASLSLIVLIAVRSRRTRRPYLRYMLAALLPAALLYAGFTTQNTTASGPVLFGSEMDRALDMHAELSADLEKLRSQRSLLEIPRSQARSIPDRYTEAEKEARAIAARWNPASRSRPAPGSGFEPALAQMNMAADMHADALNLYLQNVNFPQADIESAASRAAALSSDMIDNSLPLLLEQALAASVALLDR